MMTVAAKTEFHPFHSPIQSPSHKGKRQQQELITELRRRQGKDSRHVYEGKDGAIEDIITGNNALQVNESIRPGASYQSPDQLFYFSYMQLSRLSPSLLDQPNEALASFVTPPTRKSTIDHAHFKSTGPISTLNISD